MRDTIYKLYADEKMKLYVYLSESNNAYAVLHSPQNFLIFTPDVVEQYLFPAPHH